MWGGGAGGGAGFAPGQVIVRGWGSHKIVPLFSRLLGEGGGGPGLLGHSMCTLAAILLDETMESDE